MTQFSVPKLIINYIGHGNYFLRSKPKQKTILIKININIFHGVFFSSLSINKFIYILVLRDFFFISKCINNKILRIVS